MTRRLIVSADDLGLHEAINRGVIGAHRDGIVTSASVVACGAAFDHACALARETPSLDLGLHLTLVEERPVLDAAILKTLAPDGRLPRTYRQLFMGLIRRRFDLDEIEKELEAQIRKARNASLHLSHLDSHQHTHFFPQIRPILLRLAERHGIRRIRAARRVVPPRTKFSLLLAPFAKGTLRAARARGLVTPDTLWLPSPSGRVTAGQLLENLEALPPGVTEVVVHPGADQEALTGAYPSWAFDWQQELEAIRSPDLRDALHRHRIELTRYSELPAA